MRSFLPPGTCAKDFQCFRAAQKRRLRRGPFRGSTRIVSSGTRANWRCCTGGLRSRRPRFAACVSRNHSSKRAAQWHAAASFGNNLAGESASGAKPATALALGDAHRVVDTARGVDLHDDRIRVGGVNPVEVQDLLQVEEEPLDGPPAGVQGEGLGRRQTGEIEDAGEHGPDGRPPLPPDVAEELDGGAPTPARLHHPVGEPAPLGLAARQAADLAEAEPPVPADEPPAALRREGREPHAIGVQAIGEHQGVPGERGHRRLGPGQLPRGRIGEEGQGATEPAAHVVDNEEAAREHHRAFGPEELQAVGHGREPGAVHDDHRGEAGPERPEVLGVPRRRGRQEPGGEPGEDFGEEGGPEGLAPLEEGLGAGLHQGEEGFRPFEGLVQGLAQGARSPEDHGEPELDEGLQGSSGVAVPWCGRWRRRSGRGQR